MTLRETAIELLNNHGCTLNCYKNDKRNDALKDINMVYPSGYHSVYTNEQIALEVQKIGDEQPDPPHPQWKIHWEDANNTDCFFLPIGFDIRHAKDWAADMLTDWQCQFLSKYTFTDFDDLMKNEEVRDEWNYMIDETTIRIDKYDPTNDFADEDGWIAYWYPEKEWLDNIGWKEYEEVQS